MIFGTKKTSCKYRISPKYIFQSEPGSDWLSFFSCSCKKCILHIPIGSWFIRGKVIFCNRNPVLITQPAVSLRFSERIGTSFCFKKVNSNSLFSNKKGRTFLIFLNCVLFKKRNKQALLSFFLYYILSIICQILIRKIFISHTYIRTLLFQCLSNFYINPFLSQKGYRILTEFCIAFFRGW